MIYLNSVSAQLSIKLTQNKRNMCCARFELRPPVVLGQVEVINKRNTWKMTGRKHDTQHSQDINNQAIQNPMFLIDFNFSLHT